MSKEVFFLGAGFSNYLDSSYPSLADLTKKFMPTNKTFGDIEQYLTYLVSKLPFKDEVTIYKNLAEYKKLTKKIADYFWELENRVIPNLSDKQKEIFQIILDRKIPCVTMNYDLLLEKILLNIKQKNSKLEYKIVDFYEILSRYIYNTGSSISDYEIECLTIECLTDENLPKEERVKMPEILKLHGSINWYYNAIAANDTIYLYENSNDEDLKDNRSNFIIPPTLDKQSLYGHIAITNLWRQAYKYISTAEKFTFLDILSQLVIYLLNIFLEQLLLEIINVKFMFLDAVKKKKILKTVKVKK